MLQDTRDDDFMSAQIARSVGIQAVAHHRLFNTHKEKSCKLDLVYGAKLPIDTIICTATCILTFPVSDMDVTQQMDGLTMWGAYYFAHQHIDWALDEMVCPLDRPLIFIGVTQTVEASIGQYTTFSIQLD